ncbi:MAG: GGDEF domain-containing protein [Arcobacteraceae bacterium]
MSSQVNQVNKVIKQTFLNLREKNILATPSQYNKEFCNVANELNLDVADCRKFREFLSKLNSNEQAEVKKREIKTPEEFIPILLERIAVKNVTSLSEMISSSLIPSISLQLDEKLAKFNIKIGNSPALMFEEEIQKEMQEFITQRFASDKEFVKQKTEDIAKLVTLMGKYLNDAITNNTSGSENVSGIKEQIKAIDITKSNPTDLSDLQNKLVNAVENIENEMNLVGQNLIKDKTNVCQLEDRIKSLEKELKVATKESQIDHLTGVLTRRAFEKELIKIESNFERNNLEYAVVFFDIDFFKKINDTYGHDAGDVILKTFAKILEKQTREHDVLCRYGGEEFVAIVHFKLKRELLSYLKRVKTIIAENKFVYEDKRIQITFSAGVSIRSGYKTYDEAIKKADELLYAAKNSGRNKITLDDGKEL